VLKSDDRDWKQIASVFPNKSAEDCEKWWDFILGVESLLQDHGLTKSPEMTRKRPSVVDNSSAEDNKKRQRRPAILIDRKYKCPAPDCPRAYGTEGALKFHLKSKHKDHNYSPPRTKSSSSTANNSNNNSAGNSPTLSRSVPVPSPLLMPPRFFPNGLGLSPPVFPPTMDFGGMLPAYILPQNLPNHQYLNQNMLKVMINPMMYEYLDPNDNSKPLDLKNPYPPELGIPLPDEYLPYVPFPEYVVPPLPATQTPLPLQPQTQSQSQQPSPSTTCHRRATLP